MPRRYKDHPFRACGGGGRGNLRENCEFPRPPSLNVCYPFHRVGGERSLYPAPYLAYSLHHPYSLHTLVRIELGYQGLEPHPFGYPHRES